MVGKTTAADQIGETSEIGFTQAFVTTLILGFLTKDCVELAC